jgi:6-phosphogluconolactonase
MPSSLSPPLRPRRRLHIAPTPAVAAQACAEEIARQVRSAAVRDRPEMAIAFSGGTTPATMFRSLARQILADPEAAAGWARTHVFQVDERIAPDGDARRNANDLITLLLDPTDVDVDHRHLMAVTRPHAAALYAQTLGRTAGRGLDIAVLGLGDDGHTASLVPGDVVLDVTDAPVALTGAYRGSRRLTLTRATLDRAHLVVWLVTGAAKAEPLRRLMGDDRTIPAGLVGAPDQIVFADRDAAALVSGRARS